MAAFARGRRLYPSNLPVSNTIPITVAREAYATALKLTLAGDIRVSRRPSSS